MKKLIVTVILFMWALHMMDLRAQPSLKNSIPFQNKVVFTTASATHIRAIVSAKPYPKELMNPTVWYHWLHKDSIQKSQGNYSGKLLDGLFEEYFPNWSPKISGNFDRGIKVGRWKYWDHKGTLRKVSHWTRSEETGPFVLFNEEGQKIQEGRMKDGKLHGRIKTFSKVDSAEIKHQRYRNGILVPQSESLPGKAVSALKNLF